MNAPGSKTGLMQCCNLVAGFTLMEVLVATAITGIALGVVMGLLSQGHRQAYRGDLSEKAAAAATALIDNWQSKHKFPASGQGDIEGMKGWTYKVETEPLKTKFTLPSGETREVEPDKLVAVYLDIMPPGRKHHFRLSLWVTSDQVKGL